MEIQIAKPIHDTFIVIVSTLNYSITVSTLNYSIIVSTLNYSIIATLKGSGRQCMVVKLNSIVNKFFRIHLRRIFIEFERKVEVQNLTFGWIHFHNFF